MIAISIKRLFGRFDYDVRLKKDGLTIITGPNGYGKSTILKCIDALSRELEGMLFFSTLDFESLIVEVENSKTEITKNAKELLINGSPINLQLAVKQLERRPYIHQIDENRWIDIRRGEEVELGEYLNKNFIKEYNDNDFNENLRIVSKKIATELRKIKVSLGKIYFIKEQRLIREQISFHSDNKIVNVIEELPTKFKRVMSEVMSEYSTVSNRLDSSYPNRLFSNEESITKEDYQKNIEIMNSRFEKLNKYDLSSMQNLNNVQFRDEHAKALKIYFDDFEIKYNVYEDFINKLEMFTDIINERLSFKKIVISKELGISIEDTQHPKKNLNLMQLSSGEKQEIVLFYQLIFETENNILLLIDEPEISLHITWQKRFMDDLMKIIKYKNMNVIVATHSPQIINNHWEYQIDLGEIYAEQLNKK